MFIAFRLEAFLASDQRPALILMGIPLCVMCPFSLDALKIFSLPLVFSSLATMLLDVGLSVFILLRVCWISRTYNLTCKFFTKFGEISAIIYGIFSVFSLLLGLQLHVYYDTIWIVPPVAEALLIISIFTPLFFGLDTFYWPFIKFTDPYFCYLQSLSSLSNEFFISDTVLFNMYIHSFPFSASFSFKSVNIVIMRGLHFLPANSNIWLIWGSLSIKWFFSWLWITSFCFFSYPLNFNCMLNIVDMTS